METWRRFCYVMGSPNVLTSIEYCHVIKIFPLITVTTIHMDGMRPRSFWVFSSWHFSTSSSEQYGQWSCLDSVPICSSHDSERLSPWRRRVSCPGIEPFLFTGAVCIESIKRGLRKYVWACTYHSIAVYYLLINSMFQSEINFLMYSQDHCRSRYWSYFLVTLQRIVNHISERCGVDMLVWSHHCSPTPEQLVNFDYQLKCYNISFLQFLITF
jgi:hypothetical protein